MGCVSSKSAARTTEANSNAWDGHIQPIKPWKLEPALTSEQLERLRNEFWETRVEGRQEMWQALRFAAEAQSVRNALSIVSFVGNEPRRAMLTIRCPCAGIAL